FGVCCKGKQVFYLVNEGESTRKGANTVVSYVHNYIHHYVLGEEKAVFHFDNCAGQKKNNCVRRLCNAETIEAVAETVSTSLSLTQPELKDLESVLLRGYEQLGKESFPIVEVHRLLQITNHVRHIMENVRHEHRRETKIDIIKSAKLLKGTGIFIYEDLTNINAEVLASLRLKEPELVEKAWSRDGKLFVCYKGQERNEQVTYDKYKFWLAKQWPTKTYVTNKTTYARKVSNDSASNRPT
ncbi:hypothetical protein DPMN_157719, partial [Dreissena polymorpha]